MFEIDQLVCCINTDWIIVRRGIIYPLFNQIYTIRDIIPSPLMFSQYGALTFVLYEILNEYDEEWKKEFSFYSWHFKPIKKTNISELQKLLKTKSKELEDA